MDFDLTKENIQPLRRGRNVQQLGIALQAQSSREHQLELLQQREEFENAIRNYEGDDPLDNYYHYISWVEQSYPKNGHEGNLIPLLEHCLGKFEDDNRYTNDRRFCKLWIKYIDLQVNPLELYHMMHARGLCIGCADLYRAWAYYHEAASDFQSAHNVFESGKRALAQPYEELENAHKNLIMAAGQHTIFGPDETRLVEKRQALTSLQTYRPGRVASVRIPSSSDAGVLPSAINPVRRNGPITVYEGRSDEFSSIIEAAPSSIITAARRQEAPKENTLKPGPWTTVPVKKRVIPRKTPSAFTVHEDGIDDQDGGIHLPTNHPRETLEDYSRWRVSLTIAEPSDPRMVPMYPKDRVYIDPHTEYSIEELRSHRYIIRNKNRMSVQAIENQPVLVEDQLHQSLFEFKNDERQPMESQEQGSPLFNYKPESSLQFPPNVGHVDQRPGGNVNFPQSPQVIQQNSFSQQRSQHNPVQYNDPIILNSPNSSHQMQNAWGGGHSSQTGFNIWEASAHELEESLIRVPKTAEKNFNVYEQSIQEVSQQPKGTAMKTPIKCLNADDLVETGSRGGMDIAATAQPTDSAKPMPIFSDDSSSSFEDIRAANPNIYTELNDTCNTQLFNFNLNTMHVSTPQNKQSEARNIVALEDVGATRKQLFTEPKLPEKDKFLSTILEETKSYGSSSSSSGGATAKTSILSSQTKTPNMATISEEHNSYLAQNLMANAALRSSLLGEIMDFDTQQPPMTPVSAVQMQNNSVEMPVRIIPSPAVVTPLNRAPSDPFRPSVIGRLLERVSFPGPHSQGFIGMLNSPRVCVKKEPISLGNERYIVEKQLGKGTFGTVFKALDLTNNKFVALKYQKPPNKWEFYICRELQARLADSPLQDRFMDVPTGFFSDQSSILVSDFMPYGSLLDIANIIKQKAGRSMKESLCIYFCIEMLRIVQAMHSVQIIHADIKPDNFLAYLLPDNTIGLQLIDFGCSIDMTLFPPNSAFTRRVTTEDFVCCEMRDERPWNYHTDLFCVAASAHVLLFDKYIQLRKRDGLWSITHRLPRYSRIDLWNMFFSSLLNQQSGPADTKTLQVILDETLNTMMSDFMGEMRYLVNLLKNR